MAKIIEVKSSNSIRVQVVEVIRTSENIQVGDELDLIHYMWNDTSIRTENKGIFKLSKQEGSWRVEKARYPNLGTLCHLETDYFEVTASLEEITEGIRLFSEAIAYDHSSDTRLVPSILAKLLISDETLAENFEANAYFKYLFYYFDYYNRFETTPNHGFWQYYKKRHSEIIAHELKKSTVRFIPDSFGEQNADSPSLFIRFAEMTKDSLVRSEYLLQYDTKNDSVYQILVFTPENPTVSPAKVNFDSGLTFDENLLFDYDFFGENVYDNEHYKWIRVKSNGPGKFMQTNRLGDTVQGEISNGVLNGEVLVKRGLYNYTMGYLDGNKHGDWSVARRDNGKILFECGYARGSRTGSYFLCNRDGDLQEKGQFIQGRRAHEWTFYYYGFNLISAIKNYGLGMRQDEQLTIHGYPNLIEDTLPKLELISNYGIDINEIGTFYGKCSYFDFDGSLISIQNWEGYKLLAREDWFPVRILPHDTIQRDYSIVKYDTVMRSNQPMLLYHTKGFYKNNAPWSGTFLVGGIPNNILGSAAGGYRFDIKIEVAIYEKGERLKSAVIYFSPGIYRGLELDVNQKKKKKWRLFKKRKQR